MRVTPQMAWNFQYYRRIYTPAMVEAGNTEDDKFTLKSALYQEAVAAVTEGGAVYDLISELLREIPDCRIDPDEFALGLGPGWPAAQAMLKAQFAKIFEPESPPAGFLENVNAELEVKLLEYYKSKENLKPESIIKSHEPDDDSS